MVPQIKLRKELKDEFIKNKLELLALKKSSSNRTPYKAIVISFIIGLIIGLLI